MQRKGEALGALKVTLMGLREIGESVALAHKRNPSGGPVVPATPRQYARNALTSKPSFPPPCGEVAAGPFWRAWEVYVWTVERGREWIGPNLDIHTESKLVVPRLVGTTEIANRLGVTTWDGHGKAWSTRQGVYGLALRRLDPGSRHPFPEPYAVLAFGPLWDEQAMSTWASTVGRTWDGRRPA